MMVSTPPYLGNGAYCYANSAAMLLASIGEDISPSLIEVLTGVGLGAVLLTKDNLLFFNTYSGAPDRGLSQSLKILGFDFTERSYKSEGDNPFPNLEKDLKSAPVVLGPLDMGYLDYNPRFQSLSGVDHFILVYGWGVHEVYLHDPAGFPFVSLFREQLRKAWQAKEIGYHQDFYRSWSSPQRVSTPTKEEIFEAACAFFQQLYDKDARLVEERGVTVGKSAIQFFVDKANLGRLSDLEIGHLTHFALPLGARRALDFAEFFEPFNRKLAELKRKQAVIFGKSHTLLMRRDFKVFSRELQELAEVEEKFRLNILESDSIN